MPRTTTAKKSTDKSETANKVILKALPLELLTPEEYEAITKANYYHPESRLILQLFLQTNYLGQLARKIQHEPGSISTINWGVIERSTAKIINESLEKLLSGVNSRPWNPHSAPIAAERVASSKPARKSKAHSTVQACGCRTKHSDTAGVVEACRLGKEQGSDESWHGY